jgi:hypothetical protein
MGQPFLNWEKEYCRRASAGAVTFPKNDDWLCALAIHFGYTKAINDSWLQTICFHFGVLEPVNDSWYQALAEWYGFETPVYNNSWRYTLAFIPYNAPDALTPWEEEDTATIDFWENAGQWNY